MHKMSMWLCWRQEKLAGVRQAEYALYFFYYDIVFFLSLAYFAYTCRLQDLNRREIFYGGMCIHRSDDRPSTPFSLVLYC